MANLDSREKRASSVAINLYPAGPGNAFGTNGMSTPERQVAGYGYYGIAAEVSTTTAAIVAQEIGISLSIRIGMH